MRTFKQYLTEALKPRSKERAQKIVDRLRDKHDDDEIPHRDWSHIGPSVAHDHDMFKYQGIKTVKVKSLIPSQEFFTHQHVTRQLHDPSEKPIEVVHHNGEHYIYDGHHRAMSHRLLRKPTIKAHVWKTTKKFTNE